jgi:DNA modification methylase
MVRPSIENLAPIHDWPVGKLHPYWARKPINVVQQLIEHYSEPGATVLDPFAGSGTTLFAAARVGRKSIGVDINPLSKHIIDGILLLSSCLKKNAKLFENFHDDISKTAASWFTFDEGNIIERERFSVEGEYAFGNFKLISTELIYKTNKGKKKISKIPVNKNLAGMQAYLFKPRNFKKITLRSNSRIAVPEGALLSHYFTSENIAAINLCLTEIYKNKYSQDERKVLKFLLSSSIPLMRLSDKKASSQWPYWRPKDDLTSRSALFVLRKRIKAFEKAAAFIDTEMPGFTKSDRQNQRDIQFFSGGAENIAALVPNGTEIDLVLTDPPYADQVPFADYSAMWLNILEGRAQMKSGLANWDKSTINGEFGKLLAEALEPSLRLLKRGGHCVIYYQERWTRNWSELVKVARKCGLKLKQVMPLEKQRRSMKSVTSKGRTLDGDLILVWEKVSEDRLIDKEKLSSESVLSKVKAQKSFYKRYTVLLESALMEPWFESFAKEHPDLYKLLG